MGEAQVWLCSMGLALGILMTLFLLGLIFIKGLDVFWPKRVALVQMTEDSKQTVAGNLTFAGEQILERTVGTGKTTRLERQFFVGNKDAYGFSFVFVDSATIADISYPKDIIVAERTGYGDSIFTPVSLQLGDGSKLVAGTPGFDNRFKKLTGEVAKRRERIEDLEKGKIGTINRKIARTNLRIKAIDLDKGSPSTNREKTKLKELEKIAGYEAEYEVLAQEAAELRQRQNLDILTYRIPGGVERSQPVGEIVGIHYPNKLTFFGRIGLFAHNLWAFLTEDPREANTEGGIFPAIFGTFVMTVLMSILVTPFGVIAAVYLREYAKQGLLVQSVRISVNNLAGVPSIVFGVFGLGFFVYFVGGFIDELFFSAALPTPTYGTGGIFWASLTLALMTLPVVIVATEEALAAVPRGVREAALACGASKWQTIQRIVLPSSAPGILTGVILAMARGAGEVAPLMLVGVVKLAPALPLDSVAPFIHPERNLGFHIYDLGFQSPDSEAAKPMVFATTFLLILLVIIMNLAAILLRNYLRKKYAMANF